MVSDPIFAYYLSRMPVYNCMILNSSGGLIFSWSYNKDAPQLDSNEVIIIGSTLHSLHAISVAISPTPKSSGFTELECTTWKVSVLQTITGLKFMVFTDTGFAKSQELLKEIYGVYADYVLKNPFYHLDMPIANSCQKFVTEVSSVVERYGA